MKQTNWGKDDWPLPGQRIKNYGDEVFVLPSQTNILHIEQALSDACSQQIPETAEE